MKTCNPCIKIEKPKQSFSDLVQYFQSQLVTRPRSNMNNKMQLLFHIHEIFLPMKTAPAPSQPEKVYCRLICKPPSLLPFINTHKAMSKQCHARDPWSKIDFFEKPCMPYKNKNHTGDSLRAGAVFLSSAS